MSLGAEYRRLLTRSRGDAELEVAGNATGEMPDVDVAVARVLEDVRYLEDRLGRSANPEALAELVGSAEDGLRAIYQPRRTFLTRGDLAGLEAVVHSDGTRPVLFIHDDFIDVMAPAAAGYAAALSRISSEVRKVCSAVGRVVDPAAPLGYWGTAWAIGEGLVVTNFHVLKAISIDANRVERRFIGELRPGVAVDFGGEIGGGPSNRSFPVERVLGVGADGDPDLASFELGGINFDGLDLAVLELAPVPGQEFPMPAHVARGDDPHTRGGLAFRGRSVYVVGFPGNPRSTRPDIFGRLFAGVGGVKRLAPGTLLLGRGDVLTDPRHWIIGHDASTLGGSSGSLVVDMEEEGRVVLGLHFAGEPDRINWAHGLEGATDDLAAIIPGW